MPGAALLTLPLGEHEVLAALRREAHPLTTVNCTPT